MCISRRIGIVNTPKPPNDIKAREWFNEAFQRIFYGLQNTENSKLIGHACYPCFERSSID